MSAKIDEACKLGKIMELDRAQCLAAWQKAFQCKPPNYLSVSFMRDILADDLQCRKFGGHSSRAARALNAVQKGDAKKTVQHMAAPGAILVREWNGRVYRVEVRTEDYSLDGRSYKSLSAIARHITGAHWSGPRFFGLAKVKGI